MTATGVSSFSSCRVKTRPSSGFTPRTFPEAAHHLLRHAADLKTNLIGRERRESRERFHFFAQADKARVRRRPGGSGRPGHPTEDEFF
jgi:hypothetical protein